MSEDQFYALAFKSILKNCSPEEQAELQAALDEDPARVKEFSELHAQAFAARELLPLVAATEATEPRPSERVRDRVRIRVEKHFGHSTARSKSPVRPGDVIGVVGEGEPVAAARHGARGAGLGGATSFVEAVIARTRRIGSLLNDLGGESHGIHESVTKLSTNLSPECCSRLRFIASVRDSLLNVDGYQFDGQESKFIAICDSSIRELEKIATQEQQRDQETASPAEPRPVPHTPEQASVPTSPAVKRRGRIGWAAGSSVMCLIGCLVVLPATCTVTQTTVVKQRSVKGVDTSRYLRGGNTQNFTSDLETQKKVPQWGRILLITAILSTITFGVIYFKDDK